MSSERVGAERPRDRLLVSLAAIDRGRLVAPVSVGVALLGILIAGGVTTSEFLTVDNVLIVVRAASITGIVALGMTFVTLSGNFFSLSVEQTAALSSIILPTCCLLWLWKRGRRKVYFDSAFFPTPGRCPAPAFLA